jgi:DNA-binding CsgD family transcriptional regulator
MGERQNRPNRLLRDVRDSPSRTPQPAHVSRWACVPYTSNGRIGYRERHIRRADTAMARATELRRARSPSTAHPTESLEREDELATLVSLLEDLDSSGGRVALIRGEAGIGKSTLIADFAAALEGRADILVGACDDLLTPQPLGPLWDIARREASVASPLRRDDRRGVMEALLDLVSRRPRPTMIVLEDTQWADEATLDAITFLGRRIARTNGVLVLTYRDGEVDVDHPLRQVIGELPPQILTRISLRSLSIDAIASMTGKTRFDPQELFALTGGNPLFVTEVLAANEDVPSSVRDAVLARVSKVSPEARRVLSLISAIPGGAERVLVDTLIDPAPSHITECVRQGLLQVENDSIGFVHELQRRAIESSLPDDERRSLHAQILAALADGAHPSRLAHHARQADDPAAIAVYAPQAARAATAVDSHREAVDHYRTIGAHLDHLAPANRAAVLDEWAREEFYLDNTDALDLLARAVELHRLVGDDVALARALTFAVRVNEVNGRPEQADACAAEAVSILASHPPSAALAAATSQMSWLRLMRGDDDQRGIELADRAIAIAQTTGDGRTVVQSLVMKGGIQHSADDRRGFALVEEGHRLAVAGGYRYEEAYALINLAGLCADVRDMARAADLVRRARDTAARYEIRSFETYAQAMYAEILLWQGDWVRCEDTAAAVLGAHPNTETIAIRVLGLLQARRGRAGAAGTLQRMWSLAEASGELQNIDPAAAALAEHMWLVDDHDPARVALLRAVVDRGMRSGAVWPSAALAFWMWKLGELPAIPAQRFPLYGLIMAGEAQAAAAKWEARGCPYDQALALMHGDHAAKVRAIHILDHLGATATASRVRRGLADEGVRVPRGRSQSTRAHAAGLTARQAEVLQLLATGCSNVAIADRLFVSHRTVENHVAAILMKLDVASRQAAVEAARDRGLLVEQEPLPQD